MRITGEISIDMGHRVTNHGGKCRSLHGHRYRIEATVESSSLQHDGSSEGMILDFGFLRSLMMEHIDGPCDHGTCLWIKDTGLIHAIGPELSMVQGWVDKWGKAEHSWSWGKLYVLADVPTAENLARHWFRRLLLPVAHHVHHLDGRLYSLRVWETPNCSAIYKFGEDDRKKLAKWHHDKEFGSDEP